ncbi:hypothetical protein TGP89_363010 [Toxoplasma gondii p89]|uniref:Uncharacterized protein n=1 Tax=Toxoplasma gondii p89 TaxID=943119 RepID=A0A086L5G4_TOXGO|nr:hypothetical protein TGP89_363010 [Toxoplasma gondii p89]
MFDRLYFRPTWQSGSLTYVCRAVEQSFDRGTCLCGSPFSCVRKRCTVQDWEAAFYPLSSWFVSSFPQKPTVRVQSVPDFSLVCTCRHSRTACTDLHGEVRKREVSAQVISSKALRSSELLLVAEENPSFTRTLVPFRERAINGHSLHFVTFSCSARKTT